MADNYTAKDAGGNTINIASADIGGGVQATKMVPVDAAGVALHYKGTTILATAVSVGTSATALPASVLANRRLMLIYNNGNVPIYIGGSGVTTSTGVLLWPRQMMVFDTGGLVLYAIAATSGNNVRVLEIA